MLIVEDERKLAQALREGLEQEGFAVDAVFNGAEGLNYALNDEYDIIILDVMLPDMNGYDICQELRQAEDRTPVLMLTARDQDSDIVKGLKIGADDYLVKPFSFEVLLARIRALLRRPRRVIADVLKAADLSLNTQTKQVIRAKKEIHLSAKEYSLLEYMLRNKGRVLSKDEIIKHVWDFDNDILPNTVEVFVSYLRSKIDQPFKGSEVIKTIRGFGYKIEG